MEESNATSTIPPSLEGGKTEHNVTELNWSSVHARLGNTQMWWSLELNLPQYRMATCMISSIHSICMQTPIHSTSMQTPIYSICMQTPNHSTCKHPTTQNANKNALLPIAGTDKDDEDGADSKDADEETTGNRNCGGLEMTAGSSTTSGTSSPPPSSSSTISSPSISGSIVCASAFGSRWSSSLVPLSSDESSAQT